MKNTHRNRSGFEFMKYKFPEINDAKIKQGQK